MNTTDNTKAADLPTHGRFKVRTTYDQGRLALTIYQVDRKWMPFSLFSRVVGTRLIQLAPSDANTAVDVKLNASTGLLRQHVRLDTSDAASSDALCILGPEWPSSVRADAYDQVITALHQKNRNSRLSLNFTGAGAAICMASLVVVVLWLSAVGRPAVAHADSSHNHPHSGEQLAHLPATPTAVQPAIAPAELSSASFAQAEAAKAGPLSLNAAFSQAKKIVVRPTTKNGKGIVIWSDPLCPHCRDLEEQVIAKLPADFGVTIVPVAFRQGSRVAVSYLTCGGSNETNARRWTDLMAPNPKASLEQQCSEGPTTADSNSALFVRANLTQTPSITTANGSQLYAGALTADSLLAWAQ